jgi:hypothetical protein
MNGGMRKKGRELFPFELMGSLRMLIHIHRRALSSCLIHGRALLPKKKVGHYHFPPTPGSNTGGITLLLSLYDIFLILNRRSQTTQKEMGPKEKHSLYGGEQVAESLPSLMNRWDNPNSSHSNPCKENNPTLAERLRFYWGGRGYHLAHLNGSETEE